jgi:hypothetical protein
MILTRAFLLLLAMMTGLSAAQAAESVRPLNTPVSQQAQAQLAAQARDLAKADVRRVPASWSAAQPVGPEFDDRDAAQPLSLTPALALPATIQRSDRARE